MNIVYITLVRIYIYGIVYINFSTYLYMNMFLHSVVLHVTQVCGYLLEPGRGPFSSTHVFSGRMLQVFLVFKIAGCHPFCSN